MNVKIRGGNEVEKMIKLLACDLDGTLLDDKHQLPTENAEAIRKLQAAGIQFMTATGRNYKSVASLLEPHGIVCEHLLLNGSVLKNEVGKTVFDMAMKLDTVKKVMDVLDHEELCFNMYTSEGSLTPNMQKATEQFLAHMQSNGLSIEEAQEIMTKNAFNVYHREVKDLSAYLLENPKIYKMETFSGNVEVSRFVRKKLEVIDGIALSDSISENVEITDVRAQKGYTLKMYCEQKGILLDEVVVMGDSMNDLSMMQLFPHSIAVGNANNAIKEAASYVTIKNHEMAVAHVIDELLKRL